MKIQLTNMAEFFRFWDFIASYDQQSSQVDAGVLVWLHLKTLPVPKSNIKMKSERSVHRQHTTNLL